MFKFSQKSVKVCGYTFRNFTDAESYARTVYADSVATFGLGDKRTVKAVREWTKVQRILASAVSE